jgi:hypothetical protein
MKTLCSQFDTDLIQCNELRFTSPTAFDFINGLAGLSAHHRRVLERRHMDPRGVPETQAEARNRLAEQDPMCIHSARLSGRGGIIT